MTTSSRPRRLAVGAAVAASLAVGGLTVAAVNPLSAVLASSASSEDSGDEQASSSTEPSTTTAPADPADPGAPDPGGPGGGHGGRPQILDGALDELVEEGVITQEQADAIAERVEENAQEWRDANPPPERPGGPGGPGGGHHGLLRGAWEAAAEVIGVDPDALREGIAEGRSIAEIAEAEGVSRQAVIDAIVATAEEHIDEAVASGWLGEDGAERLRERLPDMAARLVDATPPRPR